MGSPQNEPGRDNDGETQHRVRMNQAYYLAAHEVTVGQFNEFVKATDYKTEAEFTTPGNGGGGYNESTKKLSRRNPIYQWRNVGWEQASDHPVVNVTWNDATRFCEWLSKKENRLYRLPTEAEWEYACRAGASTQFWNGPNADELTTIGNVADIEAQTKFGWKDVVHTSDGFPFTAPVGSFEPSKFGLYDTTGNVWEWCSDKYAAYSSQATTDPLGPEAGDSRVARGGGWKCSGEYCRSARRLSFQPSERNCDLGFRVAMTVEP
jgi:formylglycine-generating enzyme